MAIDKETSIFFAGGKKVEPVKTDDFKGLKLERQKDSSWKVSLSLIIPKEEAENVIRRYEDFHISDPAKFEELAPNQIFFEAFDKSGTAIFIEPDRVKLYVLYDKEDKGELLISYVPLAVGKTQNAKKQNVVVGHDE